MAKLSKKILEIKEYRKTRNLDKNKDFMITISMNLVNRLGDRNNFIHKQLDYYKKNKKELDDNLRIATGLYICSLITCWETFFRDLFIFLCNSDQNIDKKLSKKELEEKPSDLTLGEFMARKYNFQNLNQTKESFDYIFERETESLSDYFTNEVFEGVMHKDYSLIYKWIHEDTLKKNIDYTLEKGFEIRHKVTHDSNYLIEFDSKLLSAIECVFQIIPQFFVASIAKKYSQKRLVFNIKERYMRITDNPTEDERNYAFNVKDFMAEDYVIVE